MNEAKAMLMQIMKGDTSSSGLDGNGHSSTRVSGVTLREVPPTSSQSTFVPTTSGISGHCPSAAISEIHSSPCTTSSEKITAAQFPDVSPLVGTEKPSSMSSTQTDTIIPELSQIPDMVPKSIVDIPAEKYVRSETGNDGFVDPAMLVGNIPVPMELDDIVSDPDIDALLDVTTFWDDLLLQGPAPPWKIKARKTKGSQQTMNGADLSIWINLQNRWVFLDRRTRGSN